MSGCEQLPKVVSANRSPSLCVAVLRDISAPSAISRRGSGTSTTTRRRGDAENDLLGTALARPGYVRVRAVTKGLLCESFSVALRCGSSRYNAPRPQAISRRGSGPSTTTRRRGGRGERLVGNGARQAGLCPGASSYQRSSLRIVLRRSALRFFAISPRPPRFSRRGSGTSTTTRSRGGRGERLVGNGARQAGLCPGASSYQRSSLRIVLRRSALRFFAISPRPPRFRVAVRELQPRRGPRGTRRTTCW